MSYNFDTNQNHYYFNNKNSLPLIFIHGVGLNQKMWKPQIEFFRKNSFVTYDLLGHGKTPFDKQELTMENFTNQLLGLVKNLKIKKFDLIGFSIGSLIAIEFASKLMQYTSESLDEALNNTLSFEELINYVKEKLGCYEEEGKIYNNFTSTGKLVQGSKSD